MLHLYFNETLKKLATKTKVDLLMSFKNIGKAFTAPGLRVMFIVVFLISQGYGFFTQFFQVLLIEKYHFGTGLIGLTFAYVGLWIAISQGYLNRYLSRRWTPGKILLYSIFFTGIAFALLLVPGQAIYLLLVLPLVAIFLGITEPNYNAVVSNQVSEKVQGEALGITQSVQSLAYAIPPIISGLVVSIDMNIPMELAAIVSFGAWGIYQFIFYKEGI